MFDGGVWGKYSQITDDQITPYLSFIVNFYSRLRLNKTLLCWNAVGLLYPIYQLLIKKAVLSSKLFLYIFHFSLLLKLTVIYHIKNLDFLKEIFLIPKKM